MYPVIPILSFISAVLALVPLIWYLRARNIAATAIGAWLSITSLIYAVNALVSEENVIRRAPVWCDISTIFITGSRIALPAACLSICIHLERLASFSQTSTGTSQAKRQRIIFECLMCFGLPIVYIALHLIVQPRRFDLFYGFGCRPATFSTVATIFLVIIPPLMLTVATIIFAGVAWRHFLHGVQFYGKRSSAPSLTRSLYLRLVGMALFEAVLSVVSIAAVTSRVLSLGLAPIGTMARNLKEVLVWGHDLMTGNVLVVLQVEWSTTVVQSVVFFGLFACRVEAMREGWEHIRSVLGSLKRLDLSVMFRRVSTDQSSTSTSVPTLPMTVVDLSLVVTQSAGTFTPREHTLNKVPSVSILELETKTPTPEEAVIAIDMLPLESPTSPIRGSVIASSHNSHELNFDPDLLGFEVVSEHWPRTPTAIPTRPLPCVPAKTFGIGCIPGSKQRERWFEDAWEVPAHVRSCMADEFTARRAGMGSTNGAEKLARRQAIYVTVVKETY